VPTPPQDDAFDNCPRDALRPMLISARLLNIVFLSYFKLNMTSNFATNHTSVSYVRDRLKYFEILVPTRTQRIRANL
jgi:hypothetical protein